MPKVSIIIPTFNEATTIQAVIDSVKETPLDIEKEIIVINDGSTDDTHTILSRIKNITYLKHTKNSGKGAAVAAGIKHSRGTILMIQDADLEYDPRNIPALIKPLLEEKTEVVYGSRFLKKQMLSGKYKGNKMYFLGNKFLNLLLFVLYRRSITDLETGHKAFTKKAFDALNIRAKGFDFEPEITAKFIKTGHNIVEVPITYTPRSFQEGKKITWKDGIKAVFYLIKYRFVN